MAQIANATSGIAARYALALFELADEAKALDEVASDLRTVRQALDDSDDLRALVRSPIFGRGDQARAMDAVLASLGVGELSRKFVGVVIANRRLFALARMIDAYLAELARRRGEITAKVSTAHPLDDAQIERLNDRIKSVMGANVTTDVTVDPSLLGGMVVRIGSRMIDSSLKTKLDRLRFAMKGVA